MAAGRNWLVTTRAGAGDPEARALLVGEVDDADGAGRPEPSLAEGVDRSEGADDAERTVEGAAVRDGVEVGADDDAGVVGGDRSVGIAPPGPLVAHPVGRDVEATSPALALEPLTEVVVDAAPGEPAVPAGAVVEPDAREVVPHAPERT